MREGSDEGLEIGDTVLYLRYRQRFTVCKYVQYRTEYGTVPSQQNSDHG